MTDLTSFFEALRDVFDKSATLPPAQVAVSMGLSLVLCMTIASVYRFTHRGVSYSQSYAHTLIIMGVIITAIMMIVGSSIARAFSLVGAMSIIRFRNAVKETRDLGFIFMVMAIGMACGTRFYVLAAFTTLVLGIVIIALQRGNAFGKPNGSRILCLRLAADRDHESALGGVFARHLEDSMLISMESVSSGTLHELVFSVVLKSKTEPRKLLEAVRNVNENQKVSLVVGQQELDL